MTRKWRSLDFCVKYVIIKLMFNDKPYVRIVTAAIRKSRLPRAKCKECKVIQNHIHKEDLIQPAEGTYWFVRHERRKFYEKVLVDQMEKVWHEKGLEPMDEICFKDSKDEIRAVAVCMQKGKFGVGLLKVLGLQGKVLSRDKIRKIAQDVINQWEITPISEQMEDSVVRTAGCK